MKDFHIGNRVISNSQPCYIIAEIGFNHNGKEALAIKLVEEAVKAGVDAVKLSRYDSYKLLLTKNNLARDPAESGEHQEQVHDSAQKMDLTDNTFLKVASYCQKLNVDFLSTPSDEERVDFLVGMGVAALKIASGDLTADPYLRYVAKQGVPVILSTGMATMEEVRQAVGLLQKNGCAELAILHCVSSFPAPLAELNLKVIRTLAREFAVPIGFSDHTTGIEVAPVAVASGAVIIEKPFTLDKGLPGLAHAFSLDPYEMSRMVKAIRETETLMGLENKSPTEAELEFRKFGRRSIVAKMTIEPGTEITEAMLILKRPGTGISPRDFYKVLGKKPKKRIAQDEILTWDKIL
ncbi:MAG: N-acetylneuraminate synthase family protein [Bacillota bacterium]|jgi:sialic acid synthase SpsE